MLTNVNGTLYFSAFDPAHGTELWKSDGTDAGTVLVADITPGTASTSFTSLFNFNGILIFVATTAANGAELWRSDGTAAATFLLKDINAGTASSTPQQMCVVGSTLYFSALVTSQGRELWRMDGTAAETVLVKDINPGTANSSPQFLFNVNGTLVFTAIDGVHGQELWTSDGSSSGTILVKDINPGTASGASGPIGIVDFVVFNGLLYFTGDDGIHNREIWVSDGSELGTTMVEDIAPGLGRGAGFGGGMIVAGSKLFFVGSDGVHGTEMWRVNYAPTASDDEYLVNEDQTLTVSGPGVLANDSDLDNDVLSASLVVGPNHGQLNLQSDGSFTYVPDANFSGTDVFTYYPRDASRVALSPPSPSP